MRKLQAVLLAWVGLACVAGRPVDREDGGLFADADSEHAWPPLTSRAEQDRVSALPGAPAAPVVSIFSGYITVDEEAGRELFYVFVESSSKPRTDPLVLWLNGGPGCSSLGGGFLSELGPYYPTPDGETLQPNKFAWNTKASMLYLESPAFVGFSTSNTSSDARVGDDRTAADSREFLLRWFDRFPRYRRHAFWLSGESYAGHYVPQLADVILRGNKAGSNRDRHKHPINLQGFLVGNALTDAETDSRGALDFWWSHGIVSTETVEGVQHNCDFAAIDPLLQVPSDRCHNPIPNPIPNPSPLCCLYNSCCLFAAGNSQSRWPPPNACLLPSLPPSLACPSFLPPQGVDEEGAEGALYVSAVEQPLRTTPPPPLGSKAEKCDRFVEQAMEEMGSINIYDIYADVCLPGPARVARQLALMLRNHPAGAATRKLITGKQDPCIDSEAEAYLNRRDVQLALHANVSGQLPGPWQDCTPRIEYSREDLLSSVLPLYRRLLEEEDIDMLVYSGDVDAIVPVIGTRNWIRGLQLPVTSAWRPWHGRTGQVGGWTVGHGKLTFATVRGAGHMVPYTQQVRALDMFTRWIHRQPL
ncbi:Serine carboxypeptidase-like 26 [Chlorella vulgaris]